jgi:Osmosensitive K+ channel histidine kinase
MVTNNVNLDTAPGTGELQSKSSGNEDLHSFETFVEYLWSAGACVIATLSGFGLQLIAQMWSQHVHTANIVMLYLLAVLVCAIHFSRGPSVFCAMASVVAFDYFFMEPYQLIPVDKEYLTVVIVMLVVALLVNELAQSARWHARIAEAVRLEVATERIKNTLLRSVSHDLRTPLSAIMGAATTLVEEEEHVSQKERLELTNSICRESTRLERIVSNLLQMTRLESTQPCRENFDWHSIEETVGSALTTLEKPLAGKEIETDIASDLPLVEVDGLLIEQVIVNLLENGLKYAPDSRVGIRASLKEQAVQVEVYNDGPALRPGEEKRIFEKFYRAEPSREQGAGLGLAICNAIVDLHGGKIWAEPGLTTGVSIKFTIPADKKVPDIGKEAGE